MSRSLTCAFAMGGTLTPSPSPPPVRWTPRRNGSAGEALDAVVAFGDDVAVAEWSDGQRPWSGELSAGRAVPAPRGHERAGRIEHLDSVVRGLGDVHGVRSVDHDAQRAVELTLARSEGSPRREE